MAKQTINIGTTANDGTGDQLRSAFDKVNDNFTELYSDDAGDVGSIVAGTGISVNQATGDVTVTNSLPNATHTGDVTGSAALTIADDAITTDKIINDAVTADKLANSINTEIAANTAKVTNATHTGDVTGATALTIANSAVITDKIADDAVTADKLANSINTEIAANTAKVTNATHTGDVTGATALTIANDAVTAGKLANNVVGYSKLANVFIAKTAISTLTGTVSYDCSVSSLFQLSGDITGAYTISLDGYNKGQVITIFPIKGNQTLNLAGAGSSTNTFNKIGGDYDDDGSASNVLQIECVDDSATDPIFFYSIATFTEDSSDI